MALLPEQTQFSQQPVPPIRKPAQASYTHPSEGRQKKQNLQSNGLQNESHNHRKLTKMITRITAFCNSVKLWAMPCRATQEGRVIVESSDKTWSTGEGNSKPLQYSCPENPMNSIRRQKDMSQKDELPRSVGAQYATGEESKNNPRRMKRWSQSKNNTQLWIWLVMEARSTSVKSNIV